jgi:hypothetical protein
VASTPKETATLEIKKINLFPSDYQNSVLEKK